MQVSDRVLARRYALALYQSAAESEEVEKVGKELASAARQLSDKMATFKHPRISAKVKKEKLRAEIGTAASKKTLRFLDLLIEKKRFGLLQYMAADYDRIHNEERGIVHAAVRSAGELTEVDRKTLVDRLAGFSGKKPVLDVKVDADLLAGLTVRMGDWVLDASLKGELARLKKRLAA